MSLLPVSSIFLPVIFTAVLFVSGLQPVQANDELTNVHINIVNFLYIIESGYERNQNNASEVERAVLFPGIETTLAGYGVSNYGIQYDKVSSGNIDYNGLKLGDGNGEIPQNQLLIWGMVKPVNWPVSYNLVLQFYYDASQVHQVRLEVRNNTILSWDNHKCHLPTASLALLSGSLAFKVAAKINGDRLALNGAEINERIADMLKSEAYQIPSDSKDFLLSWQPDTVVEKTSAEGQLTLLLERGDSHKLYFNKNGDTAIQRFLTTNRTMNWYLDQGSLLMPEITFSTERAGHADLEAPADRMPQQPRLVIGITSFKNDLDGDEEDWLGFGLEYLLQNKFSQIAGYKLAPRDVVERFVKSDSATVEGNGQDWTIDYTIGGSYRQYADKIDVDLSIVQAFSGVRIASERYTRSYDEFFEVVDQVADKFVTLTDMSLSDEEQARFQQRVTKSMEAFQFFCKGYIENSKVSKNEEKIVRLFKSAINEDPEFWGAYYNLGTAYYNQQDYEQAQKQFNYIIDRFPSFELAYFGRGVTYLRQRRNQLAYEELKFYQEKRPDDFRAYHYLGSSLIALRRYGEAVTCLNKAVELNPSYAKTYFELGNAYFATNRYRRAIFYYNQALQYDPDYLETHRRLGESYYRMHNFNGAIEEFTNVLDVEPRNPETNFMLGITIYKQALLDEYIDAFLEMYGLLKPEEIEANRVKYNGQKERIYKEMVARFRLAQQARGNFYEATFNLALTFQEMGRPDSALYYYKKTLRINPGLAKGRLVLAKFYENQGEYEKALEEYKQSVRIDPSYFIEYPRLGKAYNEVDVLAAVVSDLEEEVRNDPHNIASSLSLANIYFAQGYRGKAANLCRKVLSFRPEQETAKQMLARIGD